MKIAKWGFGGWLAAAILLLIGFLIWWKPKAQEIKIKQQADMTSREVALLCTTDMATQYHIHPELQIMINGSQVPIPPNLGIKPNCMTSIHAHEPGSVIHVESPVQKDFTLGDFFAVWGKDFSREKILDNTITPDTEIIVTVNDERVETYENTVLRDKDKIVISYQGK